MIAFFVGLASAFIALILEIAFNTITSKFFISAEVLLMFWGALFIEEIARYYFLINHLKNYSTKNYLFIFSSTFFFGLGFGGLEMVFKLFLEKSLGLSFSWLFLAPLSLHLAITLLMGFGYALFPKKPIALILMFLTAIALHAWFNNFILTF